MDRRVRTLGILCLLFGGLVLCCGAGSGLILSFGLFVQLSGERPMDSDDRTMMLVFGTAAVLALALLRRDVRARTAGLALSAVNLLCFPLGSLFALYALSILAGPEAREFFAEQTPPGQ